MNSWMSAKVRYTKQLDNGALKRVNELYLFASHSFTECEAAVYEELGQVIRGEFTVEGIKRETIHDIFAYDDADDWYKVKLTYEGINDDDGKVKNVVQHILVTAHTTKEAYERVRESVSEHMLVDFEMPSIQKTDIIEIFPYKENLDKEISRSPVEEVEGTGGAVFSASGSDENDEDEDKDPLER